MTVREQVSDLHESLFGDFEGIRIVSVDVHGKCGSSVSTAGATTDSATFLDAGGALEIARMPAPAGLRVARIWLAWIVVMAWIVGGSSQMAFLLNVQSATLLLRVKNEELTRSGR